MQHLADLLATIPLPPSHEPIREPPPTGVRCDPNLVHDLGADLPGGHTHVWGGPPGAGKTSFLLSLLYGAAARGRRVVYATYDLPAETLGLRLLAMAGGVDVEALPDPGGPENAGGLTPGGLERALGARAALARLPFWVLPARGFSTRSLGDRLVRMPFRAEVLAVDYLQGVRREAGTDLGVALRSLSALAEQLHVAVVCALRAEDGARGTTARACALGALGPASPAATDRVGWIAPAAGAGAHRAEVVRNRYGSTPYVDLHLDLATGGLQRATD